MIQVQPNLIQEAVESALAVDLIEDAVNGIRATYEPSYVEFVSKYLAARDSGMDQKTFVEAVVREARASGVKPRTGSKAAMNVVDALATFHGLPGDLPTGWVYRPNNPYNGVGLADDESSVHSLIKRVSTADADRRSALKAEGVPYGKPMAETLIRSAGSKAEAIKALSDLIKRQDQAVKAAQDEAKAAAQAVAEAKLVYRTNMPVQRTEGEGEGAVYVFRFPSRPDLVKVGMTNLGTTVLDRIGAQIGTAHFEWPEVTLVYRTDQPLVDEKTVHAGLRDRYVNGPATEWFRATTDEVLDILVK